MKNRLYQFLLIVLSCACNGFLDEKPLKSIVVPSTIEDFQSILDNSVTIFNNNPSIDLFCTDDFEIPENAFPGINIFAQAAYVWEEEVFDGPSAPFDWARPYQQIYYANVILAEASKFLPANQFEERRIKEIIAQSKFLRSFAYFHLVTLFAPAATLGDEPSTPALPLFNEPIITSNPKLGSLAEINASIEKDLLEAIDYLPLSVEFLTRPSKVAGLALLARFYHYFSNYDKSLNYSSLTLAYNEDLMDYNELDLNLLNPFPIFMKEVLFFSFAGFNTGTVNNANFNISNSLFDLYEENDLRPVAFFNQNPQGNLVMSGNYSGSNRFFGGLSLNEIYLINAESRARANDLEGAIEVISALLERRYSSGKFLIPQFNSQTEVIEFILAERRKELVGHNFLRWSDIKRLNYEGIFTVSIARTLGDQIITLPNLKGGYFFKIPLSERNAMNLQ